MSKIYPDYVYPMADVHLPTEQPGIARRDWLAGLAMQGLASNPELNRPIHKQAAEQGIDDIELLSKTAYEIADAMIKEGKK